MDLPNVQSAQFDLVGSFMSGQEARQLYMEQRRQAKIKKLMEVDGPLLMQGDAGAIERLAQLDPDAALKVQDYHAGQARADRQEQRSILESDRNFALNQAEFGLRQQNQAFSQDVTRQEMDIRRKDLEMRLSEEQRQELGMFLEMDAAEQAKVAEQHSRAIRALSAAKTPQEWDSLAQRLGSEELVGGFNDREALLRQEMTMEEVIKLETEGKKDTSKIVGPGQGVVQQNEDGSWSFAIEPLPMNTTDTRTSFQKEFEAFNKARTDKGEAPVSEMEYRQQIEATKGRQGTRITNADGSVIETGDLGAPNVNQARDVNFLNRAVVAETVLTNLEDPAYRQQSGFDPSGFMFNVLRNVGRDGFKGMLANKAMSSPERQYFNAMEQTLAIILRKDTGAAVTPTEWEKYGPMFFPMAGDDEQDIALKNAYRRAAITALDAGLGDFSVLGERSLGYLDELMAQGRIPNYKSVFVDKQPDVDAARNRITELWQQGIKDPAKQREILMQEGLIPPGGQ